MNRKSARNAKRKVAKQLAQAQQTTQNQPDETTSPPNVQNVRKEQPPPTQVVKKILKAENEEAKTLKTVFKSDPNTQMKDFIKKAVVSKPTQQAVKVVPKTPADSHPAAVAQELLETDDDVADNLAKLFKASKSYKNL